MKSTKINADFIKILKISDGTSADIERLFSRMQKKTFQMLDHPSNVELRKKVFMIKTAVAALVMLIDFAISCRF